MTVVWRRPRVVRWTAVTAATAIVALAARWVRGALEDRPENLEWGSAAACEPAAARAEQRLADTRLWQSIERLVARRALRPFRVRPPLRPLRILNLDHGPGGVAIALAREAPQDASVIALDSPAGMAELARHRAARRGTRARLEFVRAWPNALPFVDGVFDLVVSAGGLHSWTNAQLALDEIRRTLAPSGQYLVVDFRRDLALPWWLVAYFVQSFVAPRDLRVFGEPRTSIAAAYAPSEAEWLAARARLPDLHIVRGPAWLAIERAAAV